MYYRLSFLVIFLSVLALSSFAQIKTDSLVLYYPLDGNVLDQSGNNFNGTNNGGQAIYDRVLIQANSALSLDGVNDFVQLPNDSALKPDFPMSLAFWIRVPAYPMVNQSIFRADDDANSYAGFSVQLTSQGGLSASIGSGNGIGSQHRKTFLANSSTLTLNKWHHVVVNYLSASSMEIYMDGVKKLGSYTGTASSMGYSNIAGSVGRNPVSSGGFNYLQVDLDELRLYNDKIESYEVGFLAFEYPCVVKVQDTTFVNDTIFNTIQVNDTVAYFDTIKNYNVVAYYDSVSVSDTLMINSPSGTPAGQSYAIGIYPNPNKDRLYMDFGSSFLNLSGNSIRILSAVGITVYTKPISNPFEYVDLVALGGKGTYYIQMLDSSNSTVWTRKIEVN